MTDDYPGFRQFMEARGQALSRTAFFLTADHDEAQDLLQRALVKVVPRWTAIAQRDNVEAYIRKIMLNDVRSGWRRRQRNVGEVPLELQQEASSTVDLEGLVIDRQLLRHALATLTSRQRTVLYLRFYEDLSEAQTADAMKCSIGTVKSQTHDALRRVRQSLPALSMTETKGQ